MKVSKKFIFKKSRIISTAFSLLLLCAIFGFIYYTSNDKKPIENNKEIPAESKDVVIEKPKDTIIHVAAMGDMLAHDTIIANAKTDSVYDFSKYFKNTRSSYADADIVFCDQEGPSAGEQYGISGYPSFNAPLSFPAGLQSGAGCNFINLANNHMGDKGVSVTNATIDAWQALKPLAIAGANKNSDEQNTVGYATVKGVKIALLAFADFNNNNSTPRYSVNIYHDEALVRKLATEARANADIVIVSMHWGTEDSNNINSDQQNQVNLLSSLGVDVIIGTGPHVLQKVETISRPDGGKMVVWYSLGNMLSSQLQTRELIGGVAKFDITKAVSGNLSISNLSFVPTYMHYEWTAAEAANGDLLARKNAMIYLLKDAAEAMSRSQLNTTLEAQKQYITDTLGQEINLEW